MTRATAALLVTGLVGCALVHERSTDASADVPPAPRSLCAATGGTWRDGPCCPTRCGRECPLDCVSSNCRCADDRIWDDASGCVPLPTCGP